MKKNKNWLYCACGYHLPHCILVSHYQDNHDEYV